MAQQRIFRIFVQETIKIRYMKIRRDNSFLHWTRKLSLTLSLFAPFISASAQFDSRPYDAADIDWEAEIPRVVHPDKDWVDLYEKAWKTAADRVRTGPAGLPASPYLDENCYDDQIWIWDSCFMVLFSKYAPKAYPGKETLLNLYAPLYDAAGTPLRIHLRDNPPLFAWAEYENFLFTGDTTHIRRVLLEKEYLQKHFAYFDTIPKSHVDTKISPNPIRRGVVRDAGGQLKGYTWVGGSSGMDNTVRGRDAGGYDSILWVDAIAQQALSARCISDLLNMTGRRKQARVWKKRYKDLSRTVNRFYWDDRDGYYYDIAVSDGKPCRVMTPASFWVLLADIPSRKQAASMVRSLTDPSRLGGEHPWPSLARTDPGFDAVTGEYWRGGVWLPIVYMGTKALERYGYTELADTLARRVLRQQSNAYKQVEPHTIWECYSPSSDTPSTEYGRRVRPEFCGWSALGPISLFIENVLGFRRADALSGTLYWSLDPRNGTHGISNFKFGNIRTDILYNDKTGKLEITSDKPYRLKVNRRTLRIRPGSHVYEL